MTQVPGLTRRRILQAGASFSALTLIGCGSVVDDGQRADIIGRAVVVNGIRLKTARLPSTLALDASTGLVVAKPIVSQAIYRSPSHALEVRGTPTPKGDYLVMSPIGDHYGARAKVNYLAAFRSSDKGATWSGQTDPMKTTYSMHGFIPLTPKGTDRIYAFGTQPIPALQEGRENAPIGFRYSDDDGYTWSDVTLIEPVNDPGFKGMSVMRMCETAGGVWLLGSHTATWEGDKLLWTKQYLLRSEDRGRTCWMVLPHPRPNGWWVESKHRMDEGRPISLGGDRVLLMIRTPTGYLWASWSEDAGKTWSDPVPTSLVQPDAPPMLFHMPDGATLACFHHNCFSNWSKDRSELWVSFSTDGGHVWTEPRFVLANALVPSMGNPYYDYQCSYLDAFCDGDRMHMFFPHRWKTVIHLVVNAADLNTMPTRTELLSG